MRAEKLFRNANFHESELSVELVALLWHHAHNSALKFDLIWPLVIFNKSSLKAIIVSIPLILLNPTGQIIMGIPNQLHTTQEPLWPRCNLT